MTAQPPQDDRSAALEDLAVVFKWIIETHPRVFVEMPRDVYQRFVRAGELADKSRGWHDAP